MPVVFRPSQHLLRLHNGSGYQSSTIIDERAPTGIPAEILARLEVRHLGQEGSMLKERGGASLFLFGEANDEPTPSARLFNHSNRAPEHDDGEFVAQ